jgi:hypothetical protein
MSKATRRRYSPNHPAVIAHRQRRGRPARPLAEPYYRVPMTLGLMCLVCGIVAFGTGPGLVMLSAACLFLFPAIAGWADTLDDR